MEAVRIIQGTAVPLDRSDVDTDQIIPAEWLKRVERTGFGAGLFSSWRESDPDFPLNDPALLYNKVMMDLRQQVEGYPGTEAAAFARLNLAVCAMHFGELILHREQVLLADDARAAGGGDEDVGQGGRLLHRRDLVAFHRRLQRVNRIDLGDHHARA